MKRYLLLLIIIGSCSSSDNFHLNGNIKGLQKGTVILTKSMEGSEIVLDSVSLNGSSEFVLRGLELWSEYSGYDSESHFQTAQTTWSKIGLQ